MNKPTNTIRKTTTRKVVRKTNKKTFAFIDSQNVNLSVQAQKWKLDFRKFRQYLKDDLGVDKAFIFLGYLPGNEKLFTNLQEFGFIVMFKPLIDHGINILKGNVDADMVLHTMIEINNYDEAVLITGDGDFFGLLEYLDQRKKLGKLVVPNKNTYSALLKKFRDKTVFLTDLKGKLELKRNNRK